MLRAPSIPEFFANKNVFITGGSGFIGKVLIEKLLRSCPDLKTIYLLMREKKGKSVEERIRAITDLPLFDVVKSHNPDCLKKLRGVSGDVKELRLGLSNEDQQLLISTVNIIFHVAASVRFDDSLTEAVLMNARGTREVVNLALQMKNLDVVLHTSTTYCNADKKVVEEKLYPSHADWRKTIEIAETVDKNLLNILTDKYIHPLPNTYTFAKSLAEHVVYDLCAGKIPAVVYRPSVVVASLLEPFPGWIDNFNGPMGLVAGFGKGVVRTVYCDPDVVIDYIPVDLTVKAIIMSAWKQATFRDKESRLTPSFYNGSNDGAEPTSTKQILKIGGAKLDKYPFDYVLWYPSCSFTKSYYLYFIQMVFYHLIPALLVDTLLRILGHQPMLVRLHKKIYSATVALTHFTFNEWKFINTKSYNLQNQILPCDVDSFSYKDEEADVESFFLEGVKGVRKYLLKEKDDREAAESHMKRMWWLHKGFNTLWYFVIAWLLFFKIDVVSLFINQCNKTTMYFTY